MTNIDGPRVVREEVREGVEGRQPAEAERLVPVQPLGARSVSEPEVVVSQPAVAPVIPPGSAVRTTSFRRFAPDAVVAAVVGLVLLVVGLLAMVRAGLDDPLDQPVVEVLGFTHTATLGVIEAVLGALLLICGASSWRSGAMFFGAIMAIGGFIGAVQTESFATELALKSSMAWIVAIAGVIVVAASLLLPRYATRTTDVRAY